MMARIYHLLLTMIVTLSCSVSIHAANSLEGINVYNTDLLYSSLHKEILAHDLNHYHNADNLWEILREDFSLDHDEDNPMVQNQINFWMNHQSFLQTCAVHAAPYLFYILQQAKKYHLPTELVLLPMLESSYDPFAHSSAGAAGLWQMMPNTATGYGIKQNWWYDGRRDLIASTSAAMRYLAYLQNFFNGNWKLAIAAYDTGEGNVVSAIKKNVRDNRQTDFWNLPLAQETRIYLPRLLALATIIAHPEKYPVYLPPIHNAPYLGQVEVKATLGLRKAAELAGISLSKILRLNPAFNHATTSLTSSYKILLPIENVARFSENLAVLPSPQKNSWREYRVMHGDTLADLAKHFSTTSDKLRHANHLATNTIRPGSLLIVPHPQQTITDTILNEQFATVHAPKPVQAQIKSVKHKADIFLAKTNPSVYSLQPGDTIYMIREGDTLAKIANRFHTSLQLIQAANSNQFSQNVGAKIIIPTHLSGPSPTQKYQLAAGDTIYMVRHGDTIKQIAEKFKTTPPAIRIANMLASNTVREGDHLIIPTHL